jgi:predicted secreted protein
MALSADPNAERVAVLAPPRHGCPDRRNGRPGCRAIVALEGTGMAELIIHQADDRTTFDVAVGQEFSLNLREIPTSGLIWKLGLQDGLSQIADDRVLPPESALGGAALRVFRLRAVAPGESRIVATLERAWASDGAPRERCEFTIRVR